MYHGKAPDPSPISDTGGHGLGFQAQLNFNSERDVASGPRAMTNARSCCASIARPAYSATAWRHVAPLPPGDTSHSHKLDPFRFRVAPDPRRGACCRSRVSKEGDTLIRARIEELARRYGLSAEEAHLVEASLRGFSGKEYVHAMALSVNTYKTRVRRTLRKVGAGSLGQVRDLLLRAL
jgi:hypothetical protein